MSIRISFSKASIILGLSRVNKTLNNFVFFIILILFLARLYLLACTVEL